MGKRLGWITALPAIGQREAVRVSIPDEHGLLIGVTFDVPDVLNTPRTRGNDATFGRPADSEKAVDRLMSR